VNTYSLILFIHVISAMALFIAIALEGSLLVRLRSARNRKELEFPVNASRRLGRIYGPAFLGILGGGIYLADKLRIRAAWVPLAVCATLLMAIVAGLMTGRGMSRLRKATGSQPFESLLPLAMSKTLLISYGFRAGLAVGIVFLMTAMPSPVVSLVALGAGSVAGILVALGLRGSGNYNNARNGVTQSD